MYADNSEELRKCIGVEDAKSVFCTQFIWYHLTLMILKQILSYLCLIYFVTLVGSGKMQSAIFGWIIDKFT